VFGASAVFVSAAALGLLGNGYAPTNCTPAAMKIAGAVLLSLAASAALSFLPLRCWGTVRHGRHARPGVGHFVWWTR